MNASALAENVGVILVAVVVAEAVCAVAVVAAFIADVIIAEDICAATIAAALVFRVVAVVVAVFLVVVGRAVSHARAVVDRIVVVCCKRDRFTFACHPNLAAM